MCECVALSLCMVYVCRPLDSRCTIFDDTLSAVCRYLVFCICWLVDVAVAIYMKYLTQNRLLVGINVAVDIHMNI